jgi:hypothetical protein
VVIATAENKSKIYGDENPALTISYSGFKGDDDETAIDTPPVVMTEATPSSSAGEYTIALTGGSDDHYTFITIAGTLSVGKASLTVSAADAEKLYGEENPDFHLQYAGFKLSDDESDIDVPPSVSTEATTLSDVGTYPLSIDSGMDTNYDLIEFGKAILTIAKSPLVVTADDKSKQYGDPLPELTFSFEGFKGPDDSTVLDAEPTLSTSVTTASDAGAYVIDVTVSVDNNYLLIPDNGVLTVEKALLTVNVQDTVKAYGDDLPPLTFIYSGLLPGQDASVIDTPPLLTTTATALSAPGDYDIVASGGLDNNYDFNYISGTLTIGAPDKEDIRNSTAPLILFPTNNSANVNFFLSIVASDLHGKQYVFEVNTQEDFSGPALTASASKPAAQYLLLPDTRYYVRAKIDDSDWGPPTAFTTGNALSLSYITSPADGTGGVGTNVKLTVNEIYGATSYNIQIDTDQQFLNPIVATSDSPMMRARLSRHTTYYARASTSVTPGLWGRTTSFRTTDDMISARAKDSMAEGVETEESVESIQYSIYPNPFSDKLIVRVQTPAQERVYLSLINVNGTASDERSTLSNTDVTIGKGLTSGVYALIIRTQYGRAIVKVMKR